MAKLRSALLTGPKTLDMLSRGLGISRATAYRNLRLLLTSREVVQQQIVEEGEVQFTYRLTSATLPADDALVRLALERMKSKEPKVKLQAFRDLTVLSKKTRIDRNSHNELIILGKSNPTVELLEILANQAVHAQKDQDAATIEALRSFMPTAITIAANKAKPATEREQALRFLQLTADFDTLSDLAVKIISTPGDPALKVSNQTQFGIDIQSICVNAARFPKYRSKFYDLLLSNQPEVAHRAQSILNLSLEPPFTYPQ
jgi:hypothetical protein